MINFLLNRTRHTVSFIFVLALILGASFDGLGQTTLVAYQFEGNLDPSGTAFGSPTLTLGSIADFTYTNTTGGTTGRAIRTSENGSYLELSISTIGYNAITIQWDGRTNNNNNPGQWDLTLNSGSGFGGVVYSQTLTSSYVTIPIQTLSSSFSNNSFIEIRITANNPSGRQLRLDNLVITGVVDCTNDTEPPSIVIDSYTDVIYLSSGDCNAYAPNLINLATYTDNCTPSYDKWTYTTQSPDIGDAMFGPGTHTITVTASDASGNSQDYFFDIEVIDDIDPSISCQSSIEVDPDTGECYYTVTGSELNPNSYGDNCSAVITNSINGTSSLIGEQFYDGDQITWTATDPSGNTTDCTITVDLNFWNSTLSISNCPSDIDLSSSDGNPVTATWTEPTADITGNGCILSFTSNYSPGASFPVGTTTVTYTAEDGEGNTEQCSFDVNVAGVTGYCIPTYTTGTSADDYISLVQLGDIDNLTGALAFPFYEYYSSESTDLTIGELYTITLAAGDYPTGNNISVWIDYDQSGTFETSEKLGNVQPVASPDTRTIDFTVPSGALLGLTRLRVREVYNNSNMDPCAPYEYGETEDYNVNIVAACAISSYNVTGTDSYCSGDSGVAVGLDDSETGVTYQLYLGAIAVGSPVAGTTGSSISFGDQTTAGTYTVIGTQDSDGCTKDMTGNAVVTILPLPDPAINPSPTNGATGICYDGTTAVSSVSWGAVAEATSYDVYFGAGSLPGTLTQNLTGTTYNTGTLLANTTYYWQVVPKNSCGDAIGASTWTFTTSSSSCFSYCDPDLQTTSRRTITNVEFNTIDNPSGYPGSGVYSDFTSISTDVTQSLQYALNVTIQISNNSTGYIYAWIDWDGNGDFENTGESYDLGTESGTGTYIKTANITVPSSSVLGNTRMRVAIYSNPNVSSCGDGTTRGEVEDYTLNITSACAISAFNVTGTGSYCSGDSGAAVGLDDSETGVTYQLYLGATAVGLPVAGTTGSAISFGDQTTAGTYTVVGTLDGDGCTLDMTGNAIVTILPVPDTATNPSPLDGASSICFDGAGSVSWDAVVGATSYDVYFGEGSLPGIVTSNVTTNSYSTGALTGNTTYIWKVVPKNSCGDAIGASEWSFTTFSDDDSAFGNGEWMVYAYNGDDIDLTGISYRGYYIEENLSFDTRDRYPNNGSPDEATGYQGCTVDNDYHTVIHKRTGFACGTYQIDVDSNDDAIRFYVDGIRVSPATDWGYNTATRTVWTGVLNSSSEVEIRHEDQTGGSHAEVTFSFTPSVATVIVNGGGTYCGSATLTASNGNDGTIYFQGTTSGGTDTSNPTTSVEITTAGTYYFRALTSGGCWSEEGFATVTIGVDTDGDGICDIDDLDDDNDGLTDCAEKGLESSTVSNNFNITGDASAVSATEIRLTEDVGSQRGTAMFVNKIDFSESFSLSFSAYLGTKDGTGADGIAVVFHNDPAGISAIGDTGEGMGAAGIQNGIVLEIDTWDNGGSHDIGSDHGSIWNSEDVTDILTTPVAFSNVEDGSFHSVFVSWDATTNTISYTVGEYSRDNLQMI